MITLKEHNIKPYEELCRMLETQDKVAYVSATGTGKSYVVGKYIEEHGMENSTVILVPSNAIKRSWKNLMPEVAVETYQGLLHGKVDLPHYSLIICDEMHHLGAEMWGVVFQSGIENFSGKVIGLSATPIRYLDAQRDITDEFFCGNRVDGLDLPEAISKGVLPSFQYISALYTVPKKMEKHRGKNSVTDTLFAQLDLLSSRYSFQEILRKHLDTTDQKTAVFVSCVKDITEVKALCQDVFPNAEHIEAYARMGNSVVKDRIAQFENCNNKAFFYTVDLLNEGVHIDGVDSIVMFRKTESPAVYLQQLGRALSADNKQKRVKIFDFVANHGNLKTYKGVNDGTLGWISSGIGDPEKQIVITDYAMEEIEVLERIQQTLSNAWTEEEDEILRKHYDFGRGADKTAELLAPKRSKSGIAMRACKLGLSKKNYNYSKEMIDDIIATYPLKNGIKILLQKYPFHTAASISAMAQKYGVKNREPWQPWTEEDKALLKDKADRPIQELMELFPNRTRGSILQQRQKLGFNSVKRWTEAEYQILRDNAHLSAKEIRDRFFPGVNCRTINDRKYRVLNLPRLTKFWTPEKRELFKELYSEGGIKAVADNPVFSELSKDSIGAMAASWKIRSPNHRNQYTVEELIVVADYLKDNKNVGIDEFIQKEFVGRNPSVVRHLLRQIEKGEIDLEKKIEKAKAREAKGVKEAQNA